ncbi:FAD-dependent oxidoreductase [Bacillus kwashiorkori]|uniref:FAD-dependent oxidoreductase n=1 Tax=Bacillus kwashiorkori TaxID=1522318 RepID=UPI000782BB6E|nr:FAD-dependent oxidoreductase [Bacillus kwashiorkori]
MEIKMSIIPGGKKGKVGEISVNVGDKINPGDTLVQVETAKGNRTIKATAEGTITKIFCETGDEVSSNQTLFEIIGNDETVSSLKSNQPLEKEYSTDIKKVNTDLLIIGGGPGGYVAAIYAAKNGLRVTLVEKENLGGTCLNVGCIPTKALVKSSEVYHTIKKSAEFGVRMVDDCEVDMKQVIRRKDDVKDKLLSGIDFLMEKNNIQVIKGCASFLSNEEVLVKGEKPYKIRFRDVIIATGSKISSVQIPGVDLPVVMNSTEALSSIELPKSIAIIGGGVIGMEFAFIYRNLGVDVHVIEYMDRVLTMVDPETSSEIQRLAETAGIQIHTNAKVTKIQQATNGQAIVTFQSNDRTEGKVHGADKGFEKIEKCACTGVEKQTEFHSRDLNGSNGENNQSFNSDNKSKCCNGGQSSNHPSDNDRCQGSFKKRVEHHHEECACQGKGKGEKQASEEGLIISQKVLVAVGREPNLDDLGIDRTTIQLVENGKGIAVNEEMRTNVEHIFAIGDVTNILQLAHVASHQGMVAVDNILGRKRKMDYHAVPNVIFTTPEIATVGLTEDECKEKGLDYRVSKFDYVSNGKALTLSEPEGFIKLLKDNTTQKIIGGTIIGADASSLISTITVAITGGLTDTELVETIFAHPTTAEIIHEAALGLGIGPIHQEN